MTIAQQGRIVKSNEPLLLNDPQTIWFVKSGSLVLHGILVENAEIKGNRRFLFNVGPGEALFGSALAPSHKDEDFRGILAVALEETELLELTLAELIEQVKDRNLEAIALIEGWYNHLGEWLREQLTASHAPPNSIVAEGTHYVSLLKEQTLVPPYLFANGKSGQTIWVACQQGRIKWRGMEDLILDSSSPPIPLIAGTWLEAENSVEVYTTPTQELEQVEQLPASFALLHAYFFHFFNLLEQQQISSEFRRFQQRQEFNRLVLENSMGELTSVLKPETTQFFQAGTPLLIAAGAVGRFIGINIIPPAQSEDLDRVQDPLEAIARASQCRIRRVLLAGDWWQQEHEALLGYTKANQPVALLPDHKQRYLLFDPETLTRTPIDAEALKNIKPEAYVFYRPLPQIVTSTIEIFRFGIKGYEKDVAVILVLGFFASLLGMVTPQATAILVNDAIPDSDRSLLLQLGLALFAAAFGQATFQLAQQIITLRVESAADASLQPALWDRILKLSPAFFRQYASGDLVNRLLAVSEIRSQLSGSTQRTLLTGLFALLNLGLMFLYSWQLALVGVALTLLVIIITVISSRLLVYKQRKQEKLDGEIDGLTVELINGVAKLRVAAAEERGFAAWAKKYSHRTKLQSGIKSINDSVEVFNEALSVVSSVLIFWFAILFIQIAIEQRTPSGLTAGTFLAFNAAFGVFISSATEISNTLTDILGIVPLWERAKPIVQSPLESDPSKADPGRLTGRISLEHVTFRYREDGPLTLDDVSIHAEPGEFIAMVGPSGSGKSTLFRLLLGFEIPSSGTVYYDGQDLAGLDMPSVRRQLGVVLQNVRISSAPIFESITSGALVTLDEAWEAARMAGFDADIQAMPMGMHTVISEGGSNLSGGQRQRLLIARALVLKPKILLMDEATSALDNQTQAIVTESLDKMNATRIVIAHRLSTIRNADRIYVVEAGRVVQVGNYDQLVKEGGLFGRLVARQLD
ncbi:NHLP bacteriocin export ABC transporter permease/ATPase subunit [Nodularia sp. UHCC 0506]|uniref:NHLP bacteriocin export ABC transporter permease/ATPase subunit n=1 Tax=Nodularia sp. UHCC 0506 TaxID=3110243 RepID=UPI002B21E147|nr:NHLP bacteriocin export ABC transporter permease/ATPase subunit [Nodularia sp. UHCC 0506]MEA5515378.1 NHLP bacteriocin export ABC transporter permease/ATPase subunit [Nodularia sp. UHCC 0506]